MRKRCVQRLSKQSARLGRSSRNLGPSWGGLGTVLERSWAPLEAFLERSCGVFGLSWRRFGRFCGPKHDVVGQTVCNSRATQRKSAGISATQTGSGGKTIFLRRHRIRSSLAIYLSSYLSIYLAIYLSSYLAIYLSNYLSIYLAIYLSI